MFAIWFIGRHRKYGRCEKLYLANKKSENVWIVYTEHSKKVAHKTFTVNGNEEYAIKYISNQIAYMDWDSFSWRVLKGV